MPKMIPTTQKANPGAKSDAIKYSAGTGSRPNSSAKNAIPSSAPKNAQKLRG